MDEGLRLVLLLLLPFFFWTTIGQQEPDSTFDGFGSSSDISSSPLSADDDRM
jgi:hypothetical protein